MTELLPIVGEKKGGGGGTAAPNTLRSRARVKMVEVISEGPIKGLKNGLKSVYLNETQIQNEDGSLNFENVRLEEHKGYPDDTPFYGHNAVENLVSVEVKVTNAVPTGVQRTIVEPTADAVRVIVRLNSLYTVDTKNGKLDVNSVSYSIDVRPNGGTWTTAVINNINREKCTSPTQIAHRIQLPLDGEPWDIRVRRNTPDSTTDDNQSEIFFESYVVLVEGKFTYPNTAAVAMEVNAEDVGTVVPQRAYHVEGRLLQVPTNYDPVTRTYSGFWNGNFKTAYSNNPAWVYYDLVTNNIFGIGDLIDASKIDKWMLYAIAQHSDQMVPSGYRNSSGVMQMEPRYTFNGVLRNRKEAFFRLQEIANTWRGMGYWSVGQMFVTADMPSDPVRLLTPANVVEGIFKYSSTSLKSRYSVLLVQWNDPNNFYKPAIEAYVDDALVRKYGWREKKVDLEGCTSRSLARRYAKWILDTESTATETVEFTASWDQVQARPGEVIAIADPRKAGVRMGGRIRSHSGDSIYLDMDFEPEAAVTYQVKFVLPDGTIDTRTVLQTYPGDKTRLRIGSVPTLAEANAMYIIIGSNLQPRQYRIISVEETSENLFAVTALFHDPNKYARVEQNIEFDPIIYTKPIVALPPTNLVITEVSYIEFGTPNTRINLSWTAPLGVPVKQYRIYADTPGGKDVLIGTTSGTTIDIDLKDAGLYTFKVQSVNILGSISSPATIDYTVIGVSGLAAGTVTGLVNAATGQGTGTTFSGGSVTIRWRNLFASSTAAESDGATADEAPSPLFLKNTVKVYALPSNTLLRTQDVTQPGFVYDRASNDSDCTAASIDGPVRNLRFDVTVTDRLGRTSAPASITLNNPHPVMFNPIVGVSGKTLQVTWPAQTDEDYAGTKLWIETSSGFNPLTTDPKFDGTGNFFSFDGVPLQTYYLRVGSYDVFGSEGMNISPALAVTTQADVDVVAPAVPTGLALVSSIVNDKILLVATWNQNTEEDFSYYDILIRQAGGENVSFQTSINKMEWIVDPATTFIASVRAVDGMGNPSSYCAEVSHTSLSDSTPPGVPSGFEATGAFGAVWLKWNRNAESDLAGYEIYESTTTTAPISSTVPTIQTTSNAFYRGGLEGVQTLNYWIRAFDTSGNRSGWSAMISAETVTADTVITTGDLAGLIDATSFAASIKPVEVVTSLPGAPHVEGRQVYLTTDDKVYRNTGSGWTAAVDGADIVAGSIIAGKIAAGAISAEQIAADAISASKLLVGDTSNLWLDYDMLDAALYASSTGASLTFQNNASGVSGLGRRSIVLPASVASHSMETGWRAIEPDADYFFEGKVWVGTVVAGLTGTLSVEFAASGSPSPSLTRSVTLGAKAGLYDAATSRVTGAVKTGPTERFYRFKLVKSATAGGQVLAGALMARRRLVGELVVDGAITAAKLTTGELITETAQIKNGIITDAKIADLSAAKLMAGTALAGSITVDGNALSSFADPAQLVNSGVTKIDPGRILVSGATTLADWRFGGDETSINGGKIAANTISANKIEIGSRGVTLTGIQFEANSPSAGKVSWTAGSISYINDAGAKVTVAISAGNATWTSGVLYLYWVKDATSLSSSNAIATAMGANNVILASYQGGVNLIADYGRTIIDGSFIKTGSITATQIAADAISADKLVAGAVTADKIATGAITADKVAAGSIITQSLAFGGFGNQIPNSNFMHGLIGWSASWSNGAVGSQTAMSLRAAGNSWAGARYPTLQLFQNGTATVGSFDASVTDITAGGSLDQRAIPVAQGLYYEFAAKISLHRCTCAMIIAWFDSAGTYISENSIECTGGAGSSTNPNEWQQYWMKAMAPAGAAFMRPIFRKWGTISGTDSYVFIHQPQASQTHADATEASPYTTGVQTIINGSSIRTGTITADRLAANTITAASGVIADLAVTTFKIGENAVTIPVMAGVGPGTFAGSGFPGTYYTSVGISRVGLATFFIFSARFTFGAGGGSINSPNQSTCNVNIYRNGTHIRTLPFKGQEDSMYLTAMFIDGDLNSGWTVYDIYLQKGLNGTNITDTSIAMFQFRR